MKDLYAFLFKLWESHRLLHKKKRDSETEEFIKITTSIINTIMNNPTFKRNATIVTMAFSIAIILKTIKSKNDETNNEPKNDTPYSIPTDYSNVIYLKDRKID